MVVVFMSVPCGLVDTSILEESVVSIWGYLLLWRWRQQLPAKCYRSTYLHGVKAQKTLTSIHTAMWTSTAPHISVILNYMLLSVLSCWICCLWERKRS